MLSEQNVRAKLAALEPKKRPSSAATSFASVAAVLRYPGSEPEALFIRRSEDPRDPWSGHMAFPGGRQEPEDVDLVATAIRETREEVGIELAAAHCLGRLSDVQAISRARPMDLIIVPHVFVLEGDATLRTDPTEVEEALWAPLAPMLRGETHTTRPYEHEGRRLELPGFQVEGHIVWGLTYRMLELLFEAIA